MQEVAVACCCIFLTVIVFMLKSWSKQQAKKLQPVKGLNLCQTPKLLSTVKTIKKSTGNAKTTDQTCNEQTKKEVRSGKNESTEPKSTSDNINPAEIQDTAAKLLGEEEEVDKVEAALLSDRLKPIVQRREANALHIKKEEEKAARFKSRVDAWEMGAHQGDARAQYNFARVLEDGNGIPVDVKQAVSWFTKAAEQGHVPAQASIGGAYASGKGLEKDMGKAIEWFKKAADQNDAYACRSLGFIYANGVGVQPDNGQAVAWLKRAAAQDDVQAMHYLGLHFAAVHAYATTNCETTSTAESSVDTSSGTGTGSTVAANDDAETHQRQSLSWIRKAANLGYPMSQCYLGDRYDVM
jgi:TPR repeat protein